MTLGEAMEKFAHVVSKKHLGAAIEIATLKVMQSESITQKTLASISPEDIEELRDRMLDEHEYAISTINRRIGLLCRIFNEARKKWHMPGLANPAHDMKLKGEVHRARRVSDIELHAWMAASTWAPLRPFMILAVETAMRRGELASLEWRYVNFKRAVAHLPVTKNGDPRDVPLSSRAVTELRQLHAAGTGEGRVFPHAAHTFTTAAFRALHAARTQYVKECATKRIHPDATYLVDIHLHDLRHEATSRMAPLFRQHELSIITGHRDPRMLLHYYHPDAAEFAKRLG